MIWAVAVRKFGDLLKERRLASADLLTDRAYTQQAVADEVGRRVGEEISRSLVAGWESGDVALPQPKHVNALIDMGLMTGIEACRALGFKVEDAPLRDDERALLRAYRRLRNVPILQAAALQAVEAMPPRPGPARSTRGRLAVARQEDGS